MAVYAYCFQCRRYHRRGTKIFNRHKEYLGDYRDTASGSKIPGMRVPTTVEGGDRLVRKLLGRG